MWAFRIGALVLVAATFPLWWPWVRSLPASLRARSVGGVARAGLALGVLGFVALQWVPYGWDHSNPPVLAEPAWQGEGTRALVVRGCYACHSNETEWAWHTNIAPGSWLAWRDVTSGRDALNFSEWVPGTEALEDYADEATEAVEEVEDGDMPRGATRSCIPRRGSPRRRKRSSSKGCARRSATGAPTSRTRPDTAHIHEGGADPMRARSGAQGRRTRHTSGMAATTDRAASYPSLRGKRALILGGSRGIGRAIALRLAREGCDVVVNYARSAEAAEETAAFARACGVQATIVQGDVGHEEELAAVFASVEEDGLDILVNNAARGLERPRPALEQRPKHLHRTMDVNLFGPWQASQLAAPLMEARGGGSIVNLLSPGSHHYMPDYSAVGVSKAALESLTMYLAVELAPRGIRVNGVSAGWVEGSEGEHSYRADVSNRVRPHVPTGRNVAPEDLAAAVAWVCSDDAPMLVGQVIHLDGGFGAGAWRSVLDG